jgi:hypothetical protein
VNANIRAQIKDLRSLIAPIQTTDPTVTTSATMTTLTNFLNDDLTAGVIFKPILTWVDKISTTPEDRSSHLDETIITQKKLLTGEQTELTLTPDERDFADFLVDIGQFRKEGDRYVSNLSKEQTVEALQVLTVLGDPASGEGQRLRALMVEALANQTFMATLKAEMAELAQLAAHPQNDADRLVANAGDAEAGGTGDEDPTTGAGPSGLRPGLVFDDLARRDAAAERKTLTAVSQQADEHQQQLVEASQQRQAFDDLYEAQRTEFQKTVKQGMT